MAPFPKTPKNWGLLFYSCTVDVVSILLADFLAVSNLRILRPASVISPGTVYCLLAFLLYIYPPTPQPQPFLVLYSILFIRSIFIKIELAPSYPLSLYFLYFCLSTTSSFSFRHSCFLPFSFHTSRPLFLLSFRFRLLCPFLTFTSTSFLAYIFSNCLF